MANAAKHASLQHVVWSTLEDTHQWVRLDDNRMPTPMGKSLVSPLRTAVSAYGIFHRREWVGKTIGIAGEHLHGRRERRSQRGDRPCVEPVAANFRRVACTNTSRIPLESPNDNVPLLRRWLSVRVPLNPFSVKPENPDE
jgi:hypothetical protein